MTTLNQFVQNVVAVIAWCLVFFVPILALAWWLERSTRRRQKPEVLPPPDLPSERNIASLAEWRRKYSAIERSNREHLPEQEL